MARGKKMLAPASVFAGEVRLKEADFITFRVTASGIHYLCVYITLKEGSRCSVESTESEFSPQWSALR